MTGSVRWAGPAALWAAAGMAAGLFTAIPAEAAQVSSGQALHLRAVSPVVSQNNAAAAKAGSLGSADAVALIHGVVQAVDPAEGSLTVGGQPLRWDPVRLRVFLPSGAAAAAADLRTGQRIRFAIDASSGEGAKGRVVLIYIEGGR